MARWQAVNHRPRHEGGAVRADGEVLLDAAARRTLGAVCGVGELSLGRALPSWGREDPKLDGPEGGRGRVVWRVGGVVAGPVAFGCRLCTARRTGEPARVMRYAPRWERVCVRHGRWALDADADQPREYLDLRGLPEVVAAQRRWAGVVRRAVRAGVDPGEVFGLAYAVVARWWEGAYGWEREEIWPRRLHLVAGGDAGVDLEWWRVVGRDAVIFPEVVAVADALLDPVMAQLVWVDSGGERPRPLGADGKFCRRLGERVGRSWLGPLIAVDYGGPLIAWMGTVVRLRRHPEGRPGLYARFGENVWWVRQEHQPSTVAAGLRVLAGEKKLPGSGTNWRAVVPAEQRFLITNLLGEVEEQLQQLRGAQVGTTAEVARSMLEGLSRGTDLLDQVLGRVMVAAVNAGMRVDEVARWARLSEEEAVEVLGTYRGADGE
ncbi:DNA-binding protein (plasmid) [Streptomyces sp. NBC_00984]|uniref:DNA-binding protein n=1 Tax=Streptomyces sp. NBC_00984 TaxID=2903700 RepID=UPI002F913B53|nr:DNA-binding protein [Streptomyces sp. NBC_00984]WSX32674.1 DNA-binding protein [Streptomyces sp. NBC_00984]WSX33155.1 DNA-binding protein [Streptomyces sp. NBC_00984]WSX33848.1 DNA-binding protein [Streptomyces sp. NBC_00984]WSX33910.1 DNA-binding protein [Streptomyces sp. NBC_00984]